MTRSIAIARSPIADTGLTVTMWVPGNGFFAQLQTMELKRVSWASILRIMQRYYAEMGTELQLMVVDAYRESVRRPDVATGRLAEATLDEQNFFSTPEGFTVGVPSFLNRSQAKYWRQIEHGTAIHVGREIYGVWGRRFSGEWHAAKYGRYPGTNPPYTLHGQGDGEKFQPMSTMNSGAIKRRHQAMFTDSHEGAGFKARISRPIIAQDAYTRAFREFRRKNRPLNLLRAVVAQECGLSTRKVPRSYQGIIDQVF